jgi:hypothetical protein
MFKKKNENKILDAVVSMNRPSKVPLIFRLTQERKRKKQPERVVGLAHITSPSGVEQALATTPAQASVTRLDDARP